MTEPARPSKSPWGVVGCLVLAAVAVPCAGVGLAIGLPAFVTYARRSKAAEARAHLGVLRTGVEAECASEGSLPAALAPTLPVPGPERRAVALDPRWSGYGLPSEPLYYAYSIERPGPSTAVIVAAGDLDGDGVRSRYAYTCTLDGTSRGCTCGELIVLDELE